MCDIAVIIISAVITCCCYDNNSFVDSITCSITRISATEWIEWKYSRRTA